jgi:hypothetical protein
MEEKEEWWLEDTVYYLPGDERLGILKKWPTDELPEPPKWLLDWLTGDNTPKAYLNINGYEIADETTPQEASWSGKLYQQRGFDGRLFRFEDLDERKIIASTNVWEHPWSRPVGVVPKNVRQIDPREVQTNDWYFTCRGWKQGLEQLEATKQEIEQLVQTYLVVCLRLKPQLVPNAFKSVIGKKHARKEHSCDCHHPVLIHTCAKRNTWKYNEKYGVCAFGVCKHFTWLSIKAQELQKVDWNRQNHPKACWSAEDKGIVEKHHAQAFFTF